MVARKRIPWLRRTLARLMLERTFRNVVFIHLHRFSTTMYCHYYCDIGGDIGGAPDIDVAWRWNVL